VLLRINAEIRRFEVVRNSIIKECMFDERMSIFMYMQKYTMMKVQISYILTYILMLKVAIFKTTRPSTVAVEWKQTERVRLLPEYQPAFLRFSFS